MPVPVPVPDSESAIAVPRYAKRGLTARRKLKRRGYMYRYRKSFERAEKLSKLEGGRERDAPGGAYLG